MDGGRAVDFSAEKNENRQGGQFSTVNKKKMKLVAGVCLALTFASSSPLAAAGQESDAYKMERRRMVAEQLASRDISDPRVLEVMGKIPRHLFVSPAYRDQAYEDSPLPIEEGQTISQPYIVALMTQWLGLKGGERVLEIGTGSGYQAAVLSALADEVVSIEIHERLAALAARTLLNLGYKNVQVKSGDGYQGWPQMAPFDAIIVTCAASHVPPALFEQLKEGGRLVIPLGSTLAYQTLTLVTKEKGKPRRTQILDVRFVPMTGEAQKKRAR
jgi:protein-L-isoaspartate(D-aspartate) O-methyltransferase